MSKSRNEDNQKVSLTIFSLKDAVRKTKRPGNASRLSSNNSSLGFSSSRCKTGLNKKLKTSILYDTSMKNSKISKTSKISKNSLTNSHTKNPKKAIKPIIGKSHSRSRSNIKSLSESILQTFDGFMRSLINFKTDLLGLQHNDRYSNETENLVKLIQKYLEK